MNNIDSHPLIRAGRRIACLLLLLSLSLATMGAETNATFDVLFTSSGSFSNVVVISRTATHVTFQHSRGIATIKVADLDVGTKAMLDGTDPVAAVAKAQAATNARPALSLKSINRENAGKMKEEMEDAFDKKFSGHNPLKGENNTVLFVILGLGLAIYLFNCYCLSLICKKTGNDPGVLVWIPILQMFPMLRAAGMSAFWFLAFLLPVLNLIASLVWCVKICQARGKGTLTIICLILPVTNIFAFLYLAFSAGEEMEKPAAG